MTLAARAAPGSSETGRLPFLCINGRAVPRREQLRIFTLTQQIGPTPEAGDDAPRVSWRSVVGLNAANFFLAEVTGVTLPFVAAYLKDQHFPPFTIGLALTVAGLGVFLAQAPAGFLTDRVKQRVLLLAGSSAVLGVCYGLVPLVPASSFAIDQLLFFSGVAQSIFLPVLGALALALAGRQGLSRMMGWNQGWNHAGNLAAALSALGVGLRLFASSVPVFYAVLAVSVLAAASAFLIRGDELSEERVSGRKKGEKPVRFLDLLRDRRVAVLIAATALFHLANAPVMPLVAQYVKDMEPRAARRAVGDGRRRVGRRGRGGGAGRRRGETGGR